MNKLQQDIKNFHENIKPTLEKVLKQYDRKTDQKIYNKIIKPCKKLIQKCSFKSVSDTSSLCSLAYWLYIYNHKELELELCESIHGVDFEIEYWTTGILNIYGLEIRIAREFLGENRKDNIPSAWLSYYFSKKVKKELRYPQILREKEITACSDLDGELFYALCNMIGKGETELYTDLNKNWDRIEETITDYLNYLREE